MSIKKLAKAINNVAEAIRYHADKTGNETLPMAGSAGVSTSATKYKNPQSQNIPKYGCAEREYIDPYDQPPTPSVNNPEFIKGLVPAFQTSDKPVNAPGWQTLTVEDLEAEGIKATQVHDEIIVEMTAAEFKERFPADAPPPPEADHAPMTPSEKEAEPSEYDVSPPAAGAAELDSAGLPWDERIHSSGKSFLADGTWRLKRGVDDETMQAVTDELKQVMAVPTPPTVDAPQGKVTTLAQFAKACTDKEIGAMLVTAAVQDAGLQSVGQLSARPDLIPQIAEKLGL